jgi:hypothetical protein
MVEIREDVPGLPAGTAARIHTVATDGGGRVEQLAVGAGQLWVCSGNSVQATATELVSVAGSEGVLRPKQGQARLCSEVFDDIRAVPGLGLALAATYRHKYLGYADAEGAVLTVVDGPSGSAAAKIQVFGLTPCGPRGKMRGRFLGFTSGLGVLGLQPKPGEESLLAIAPDGAIGCRPTMDLGAGGCVLTLGGVARLRIGNGLIPAPQAVEQTLRVRLEATSATPGLQPVYERIVSVADGWEFGGIPVGGYHVTVGPHTFTIEIEPGEIEILE